MAIVLLVEDDPDQLDLRCRILEAAGHTVLPASSVSEALAHKTTAQVAVLDLRIPDLNDGLNLIQRLQERAPAMKLIVLSGWTKDLKLNVDQILEKPVRSKSLLQHIARLALMIFR